MLQHDIIKIDELQPEQKPEQLPELQPEPQVSNNTRREKNVENLNSKPIERFKSTLARLQQTQEQIEQLKQQGKSTTDLRRNYISNRSKFFKKPGYKELSLVEALMKHMPTEHMPASINKFKTLNEEELSKPS